MDDQVRAELAKQIKQGSWDKRFDDPAKDRFLDPANRFVRVEEHTVESLGLASNNIMRHLHKQGRAAMIETVATMIREDKLDSETRELLANWLEVIAARER